MTKDKDQAIQYDVQDEPLINAWQNYYGEWRAKDFKWFCFGRGFTKEEAIQEVRQKVAKLEAEEKEI